MVRTVVRSLVAAVAAMLVASTLVACSSDPPAQQIQVVEVLWYGEQPDGSLLSGTVATEVALRRIAAGVDVDVEGLRQSGAGEQWVASAWTAAMLALLTHGEVPEGIQLTMAVDETIDGPSAGGLMAVAALADLEGGTVAPNASMTGTIHPNGAIGPVGGIPEKLRAAAKAGITTVVVPASKQTAIDPRTGTEVDVATVAADLGITVVFVDSLFEARSALLGTPVAPSTTRPPALPPALATAFDADADAMVDRLANLRVLDAPAIDLAPEQAQLVATVAAARAAYDPDTSRSEFASGFELAAMTERLVAIWNAEVTAIDIARTQGAGASATAIATEAGEVERLATAALVDTATTPFNTVEQLVALIDAATWATGALDTVAIATGQLARFTPTSTSGFSYRDQLALARAAGAVAAVRFDVERFAPIARSAATVAGKVAITDDTLDRLALMAEVVEGANDANLAVITTTERIAGLAISPDDVGLVTGQANPVAPALAATDSAAADSAAARLIITTADALSRFVASSELINLDRAARPGDGLLNRLTITDPGYLAIQVGLAIDLSQRSMAEVRAHGADPAYLQWQTELAEALLTDQSGVVTSDERIEGLRRLWFANLAERLLVALTRPQV